MLRKSEKQSGGWMSRALDKEAYEWLVYHHAEIADALVNELFVAGETPDSMYRLALGQTQRSEISKRIEMAARHLLREEIE